MKPPNKGHVEDTIYIKSHAHLVPCKEIKCPLFGGSNCITGFLCTKYILSSVERLTYLQCPYLKGSTIGGFIVYIVLYTASLSQRAHYQRFNCIHSYIYSIPISKGPLPEVSLYT